MDRLLRMAEIESIIDKMDGCSEPDFWDAIAKAQLAKTDKEWVKWIEKTFENARRHWRPPMDRLLNDAEVCKICRSGCDRIEATQCDWRDKDECHNLIVAQLAKSDKWWISEMDRFILPPPCFNEYDTPCTELDCEDFPCTYMGWQRLKKVVEAQK